MRITRSMVVSAFKSLRSLQIGRRWASATERMLEKIHTGFLMVAAFEKPVFGIRTWLHTKTKTGLGLVANSAEDFLKLTYEYVENGIPRILKARIPLSTLDPLRMLHVVKQHYADGRVSESIQVDDSVGVNTVDESLVRRMLHPKLFSRILGYLPERDHLSLNALFPQFRAV